MRVDHTTLTFAVAADLASAEVIATYELTNPGAAGDLEAAFVYLYPNKWRPPGQTMTRPYDDGAISVDGSPASFRVVSEAEVLEPELEAWLAANPRIEAALREIVPHAFSASDTKFLWVKERENRLPRLVAAAGGRCDGGCGGLIWWYCLAHGYREDDRRRWVGPAAQEAIPGIVLPMTRDWSTLDEKFFWSRRMEWLRFRLDFAAGQTRTVTVRYKHRPGEDYYTRVNPTFRYDFLLAPARSWAGFGPLAVSVELPQRTLFASPSPFTGEGDHHGVVLPEPQDGELRFEVMTLRGLWFGVAGPEFYWYILMIAAALTTLAVGWVAVRQRRSSARGRVEPSPTR